MYISLWKKSFLYFGTFEVMTGIVDAGATAVAQKRVITSELSGVGVEN
jgi:hypothetical protein